MTSSGPRGVRKGHSGRSRASRRQHEFVEQLWFARRRKNLPQLLRAAGITEQHGTSDVAEFAQTCDEAQEILSVSRWFCSIDCRVLSASCQNMIRARHPTDPSPAFACDRNEAVFFQLEIVDDLLAQHDLDEGTGRERAPGSTPR